MRIYVAKQSALISRATMFLDQFALTFAFTVIPGCNELLCNEFLHLTKVSNSPLPAP